MNFDDFLQNIDNISKSLENDTTVKLLNFLEENNVSIPDFISSFKEINFASHFATYFDDNRTVEENMDKYNKTFKEIEQISLKMIKAIPVGINPELIILASILIARDMSETMINFLNINDINIEKLNNLDCALDRELTKTSKNTDNVINFHDILKNLNKKDN